MYGRVSAKGNSLFFFSLLRDAPRLDCRFNALARDLFRDALNEEAVLGEREESKRAHESKVLMEVIDYCKKAGGNRKKAAGKIAGKIVARDKPDLAILRENGSLIGIEHFRVDHHVKGGKKAESKSAELSRYLEGQRKRLAPKVAEGVSLDEAAGVIADGMTGQWNNVSRACCADLCRSLRQRLFDPEFGHEPKLNIYEANIRDDYGPERDIELGYLIEFHSDFSKLYLHQGARVRRLREGECPLFEDVYDLLAQASKKVDWILIGFYPTLGENLVDAAIINCRNGMFSVNAKRQGFERVKYLGLGKDEPLEKNRKLAEPKIRRNGDSFEILLKEESSYESYFQRRANDVESVASALNCSRQGEAFALAESAQRLYNTVLPLSRGIKGKILASDVVDLVLRATYQQP